MAGGNFVFRKVDGNGKNPICQGLFMDELQISLAEQQRFNPWAVEIPLQACKLGDLLGHGVFDLLARHIYGLGKPLTLGVYAGSRWNIREIFLPDDARYRLMRGKIFVKK